MQSRLLCPLEGERGRRRRSERWRLLRGCGGAGARGRERGRASGLNDRSSRTLSESGRGRRRKGRVA